MRRGQQLVALRQRRVAPHEDAGAVGIDELPPGTAVESAVAGEGLAFTVPDHEEARPADREVEITTGGESALGEIGPGGFGQDAATKSLEQPLRTTSGRFTTQPLN